MRFAGPLALVVMTVIFAWMAFAFIRFVEVPGSLDAFAMFGASALIAPIAWALLILAVLFAGLTIWSFVRALRRPSAPI